MGEAAPFSRRKALFRQKIPSARRVCVSVCATVHVLITTFSANFPWYTGWFFLTVPTQNFLSTRKKQSIRTVPIQKFLSTRKKQSIRTVPTQKFLSVEKSRYCQGISHYSFILFLHMRKLSPEKCELVNIWKYCRGGNSSGNLNFFFVYSGWEQFGYFNFFLS